MTPVTPIAVRALKRLGGPRIVLAAVPGGIQAVADHARVSPGRVSQVLRQDPLPRAWAQLLADLIGCGEVDVYQQLGQRPPASPFGPLFDAVEPPEPAGAATLELGP